jgi:glutaredoxin
MGSRIGASHLHSILSSLRINRSISAFPPSSKNTRSLVVRHPVAMSAAPSTVLAPRVAVITTQGCKFCRQAKASLDAAGLGYEEIELSGAPEVLAAIKSATGQSTVPQASIYCYTTITFSSYEKTLCIRQLFSFLHYILCAEEIEKRRETAH